MTVYTSSGSVTIPPTVNKVTVIMKGEGGLGSEHTPANCTRFTNLGGTTFNGSCNTYLAGSGGDTTFLNTTAGGGKGGYYGTTANDGGPGGTYNVPAGLISASNGNDGGPGAVNNTVNVGGSGPGGAGTQGAYSSYSGPGNLTSYCCGQAQQNATGVAYCQNSCSGCTQSCGYVGGVNTLNCCRCTPLSTVYCYGPGGGAGAYVEFELTRLELEALGFTPGTTQAYTVNEGDSDLDNGSIDIIFSFTKAYIKTSQGWKLVKDIYVKADSTNWSVTDMSLLGPPPV